MEIRREKVLTYLCTSMDFGIYPFMDFIDTGLARQKCNMVQEKIKNQRLMALSKKTSNDF